MNFRQGMKLFMSNTIMLRKITPSLSEAEKIIYKCLCVTVSSVYWVAQFPKHDNTDISPQYAS